MTDESTSESAEPDSPGAKRSDPADADEPPARPVLARDDQATPITVSLDDGVSGAVDPAWIEARLGEAAGHLPAAIERADVLIVNDAAMQSLNARFHDSDAPTDVLAFPASEPGGPVQADIAVNVDEAQRAAAERSHTAERELLLYALHGLLHCCGFDDHDARSAAAMHDEEDRILSAIGVGVTYHADSAPQRSAATAAGASAEGGSA